MKIESNRKFDAFLNGRIVMNLKEARDLQRINYASHFCNLSLCTAS